MASTAANVVIIGGGVIGASTAYFLTRQPGFSGKVTLVEGTAIASGASGKSGGFLAKDWHSAPTAALGLLSYQLHEDLAREHDGAARWGYRTLDTLSIECSGRGSARSRTTAPSWLDQSLVKGVSVLGEKDSTAQVTPRLFTQSLVDLAKEKGAEVVLGEAVGLRKDGEMVTGVTVRKQAGKGQDGKDVIIDADEVVISAGPWSSRVAEKLLGGKGSRVRIEGSRAHSIILSAPAFSAHALFVSGLQTDTGSSEPELYARSDGTVYVCGAADDAKLPANAGLVDLNPESIRRLKRDCALLSPKHLGEEAEVVAEQACFLPISRTGSPLVTKLQEGVWIAAGHAVWGITLGPGTGKVLAELITNAKPSADVRYLRP